jgi:Family of unknown function (DUF6281)
MDELKELLEEKRRRFTMPERSFEALQARKERRRNRRLLAGAVAVIILGVAVGGVYTLHAVGRLGPRGTTGDASCAFMATFGGRSYDGQAVMIAPVPGDPVGYAVLPGCKDTNGPGSSVERVKVFRFPGLPASVALVMEGNDDTVLVLHGLKELPPAVAALVPAPTCRVSDVPILFQGPWLGILGANGKTELDLVPPYDVYIRATSASDPRYERARLSVHVPDKLGRPISHADVANSLWKGGSIAIAACQGSRFVATDIEVIWPTPLG